MCSFRREVIPSNIIGCVKPIMSVETSLRGKASFTSRHRAWCGMRTPMHLSIASTEKDKSSSWLFSSRLSLLVELASFVMTEAVLLSSPDAVTAISMGSTEPHRSRKQLKCMMCCEMEVAKLISAMNELQRLLRCKATSLQC